MTETPDSRASSSITRAAAERRTTSIQDRVIAPLPEGAVARIEGNQDVLDDLVEEIFP